MLVASVNVFRHGQRSPYPPPNGSSAAGPSVWSKRALPSAAAWNMTPDAFATQQLSPNGEALMWHTGQHVATTLANGSAAQLCSLSVSFIADGKSARDVASAEAFARGFFPEACRSTGATRIVAPNSSHLPSLLPIANDHATTGPYCAGPTEEEVSLSIGGQLDAITEAFRPQIDRISAVLGCCSPQVCEHYALPQNCSLADLPYEYTGHYYRCGAAPRESGVATVAGAEEGVWAPTP